MIIFCKAALRTPKLDKVLLSYQYDEGHWEDDLNTTIRTSSPAVAFYQSRRCCPSLRLAPTLHHDLFRNNEQLPGGTSEVCNIQVTSGEFQTNFGSAARFLAAATRQFSFAPASLANLRQFPSNPATD
ncbi:hypothetical protein NL676_030640 [Syzygium grande]|nr:hypothetical protein NL676_030640 [Syzygium grande]